MSDSNGYIYDKDGIDLDLVKEIKEVKRGRIKDYLNTHKHAKYMERTSEDSPIWTIKTDIAQPCATQNEVTLNSAKALVQNGVIAVGEGANMPCTKDATEYFLKMSWNRKYPSTAIQRQTENSWSESASHPEA